MEPRRAGRREEGGGLARLPRSHCTRQTSPRRTEGHKSTASRPSFTKTRAGDGVNLSRSGRSFVSTLARKSPERTRVGDRTSSNVPHTRHERVIPHGCLTGAGVSTCGWSPANVYISVPARAKSVALLIPCRADEYSSAPPHSAPAQADTRCLYLMHILHLDIVSFTY